MESEPTLKEKIKNIVISQLKFEKELENYFLNKNIEQFPNSSKSYYLINKLWFNEFKKLINYDKIKESIHNISNNEEEEIINNELINLNETGIYNILNINEKKDKDIILKELLENKNFPFEIINEEIKNELVNIYNNKEFIKINIENKNNMIFIGLESNFDNKNIFILFFIEQNYFYQLFIIIDCNKYNYLLENINNKDFDSILKFFGINKSNINENGEIKNIDLDNNYKLNVISKRINNSFTLININNQDSTLFNNQTKYLNSDPNYEKIIEIFNCLNKNKEIFAVALEDEDAIHENYSPCKIVNLKWIEKLKNNFSYKENHGKLFIKTNITPEDLSLFKNSKLMCPNNIEKGEFYICSEVLFLSIIQFLNDKEQNEIKEKYKDNEIFLSNKKGAIIIDEDIYIFETINNDVNQRSFVEKIQSKKKNELMKKMLNKDDEYELNQVNWEDLKLNIFNNKKDINKKGLNNNFNKNNNIISNNNIINNNIINNNNIIKNNNIINDNNYNNNKISNIKNEDITNKLIALFAKERELKIRKDYLDNLEQQLIPLRKITLDRTKPTKGLKNIGATCYMNAILQCMAHLIEVSEEILTWYKYKNDKNKKTREISYVYAELLDNLFYSQQRSYSPDVFKQIVSSKNKNFEGIQANDSKDMLNFLVEEMHKELNDLEESKNNNYDENVIINQSNEYAILNHFKQVFAKNYHSIFSKYLYGIQKNVTKCRNCGTFIFNFQTYNFLIFPLLEVKNFVISNNYGNMLFNYQNYTLNLYDCFNYYQKIEFFTGQNSIYCNICNSLQNADYMNLLYDVPTVLCIVLNRGKNNADFNEKFNILMDLNLMNYVGENPNTANYYLIGVVCHVGESNMNGHFFAYCRSHIKSPWYKYNDEIVSQCNEQEILNAVTPYILFYHKY